MVLLTGAAGLIGSASTRLLDERGHDVLATDLHPLPAGFEDLPWRRLDVRQGEQVRAVFAQSAPDVVVHLAARHFIPWCERYPAATLHTNVVATQNVIAGARDAGVGKLVFASSAAVYAPSRRPLAESSPLGADDIYGTSKVMGEQLVALAAQSQAQLDTVVLRLFNTIGPGDVNLHLIPRLARELRTGGGRVRLGNLQSVRDYIHVEDVARAIAAAVERELRGSSVLNVGSGIGRSVGEVVECAGGLLGRTLEVVSIPARRRAVDRPILVADIQRARQLLDWEPLVGFEDALASVLQTDADALPELIAA
jgi:UDP-glucose 4-epimerase